MEETDPSRRRLRSLIIWGLVIIVVIYFFLPVYRRSPPRDEITYSDFIAAIQSDRIATVTVEPERVTGTFTDGRRFVVYVPANDASYVEMLRAQGVPITVEPGSRSALWPNLLSTMVPFLLLVALWMLMLRQAQSGSSGIGGKLAAWKGRRVVVAFRDASGRTGERRGVLRAADRHTLELEDEQGRWMVNAQLVEAVRLESERL